MAYGVLGLMVNYSCYCERRSRLPRIPGFRPSNGDPINPRLVKVTRIYGNSVWSVLHDSWFNYLVRDAEDEEQPVPSMDEADTSYPKSPTARGTLHLTISRREYEMLESGILTCQ